MSVRAFVDTNILVYAHDRAAGRRHSIARQLVVRLWQERAGVLSTQVLQEVYVNVRRKSKHPLSPADARDLVRDYMRWRVVVNDGSTILGALELEERFQISFWDAMILQAARTAEVSTVFSEDLNDGQLYESVQVVNPFRADGTSTLDD